MYYTNLMIGIYPFIEVEEDAEKKELKNDIMELKETMEQLKELKKMEKKLMDFLEKGGITC